MVCGTPLLPNSIYVSVQSGIGMPLLPVDNNKNGGGSIDPSDKKSRLLSRDVTFLAASPRQGLFVIVSCGIRVRVEGQLLVLVVARWCWCSGVRDFCVCVRCKNGPSGAVPLYCVLSALFFVSTFLKIRRLSLIAGITDTSALQSA